MGVVGDILQPTHLLFVLIVALLVLGPKRLPEVARTLGNGLRDFRSAISGDSRDDETPRTILPHDDPPAPPAEPASVVHSSAPEAPAVSEPAAAPAHEPAAAPVTEPTAASVHEPAVHEPAVHETAVHETAVREPAPPPSAPEASATSSSTASGSDSSSEARPSPASEHVG